MKFNRINILIIAIALVILSSISFYAKVKAPEAKITATPVKISMNEGDTKTITVKFDIPDNHHAFLKSEVSGIPIEITQAYSKKQKEVLEQGIEIINIKKPDGIKEKGDIILRGSNNFELSFKLNDKSKLKKGKYLFFQVKYQLCEEKKGMCFRPKSKVFALIIK